MILYVASSNPGKLRDFAYSADGYLADARADSDSIRIEPLPGLSSIPPPPEDEDTFEGNARLKVIYYAAFAPGELVLADDSGLEVSCLDGAPGVRSARYADDIGFHNPPPSTAAPAARTIDARNNAALLQALDGVPEQRRQARYRCVLALARSDAGTPADVFATAEGSLEGRILTAPRGALGFGYDPLFLIPEIDRTMAELDPLTRLTFSHRGRALRSLLTAQWKEVTEAVERQRGR